MKEHKQPSKKKTLPPPEPARVIGFDNHPDSFTAAILTGSEAASAVVQTVYDKIAQGQLEDWLCKHTKQEDTIVMEASDNSFAACEAIRALGRKAVVLESEQCAKIGKRYCANDRSDAVKLARLYLSGLAGKVWIPDATTRLRREVFYAYQQSVPALPSNRMKSQFSIL